MFLAGLSISLFISVELNPLIENLLLSLVTSIIGGVTLGLILLAFIFSGLLWYAGKVLNGESDYYSVKVVVGLSFIPHILILIIQILHLLMGEVIEVNMVNQGLYLVVDIFRFSILIVGLSRIQKFSYGFAIVSVALAFVPLLLLRWIIHM